MTKKPKKNAKKKKNFTVQLDDDFYQKLSDMADELHLPMTEYCRRSLAREMETKYVYKRAIKGVI